MFVLLIKRVHILFFFWQFTNADCFAIHPSPNLLSGYLLIFNYLKDYNWLLLQLARDGYLNHIHIYSSSPQSTCLIMKNARNSSLATSGQFPHGGWCNWFFSKWALMYYIICSKIQGIYYTDISSHTRISNLPVAC